MEYETDYDLLKEKIDACIANGSINDGKEIFNTYHSVDIDAVLEDLDTTDLQYFLFMLDPEEIANLIENAREELQVRMAHFYSTKELIDIFSYMTNADVADLLGLLPTSKRKDVLNYMKKSESNILQMILSYDDDSAAGIMTTEFISLKQSLTVREALLKIKEIAPTT